MKKFFIFYFIVAIEIFASNNLFDKFDYTINNYGDFVLSKDKKSFYSKDPFSLYQIKQIDINTTKVIAKYKRYKDIDLQTKKEKLAQKFFPKLYKDYHFRYDIDEQNHIIYYANKLNQIVGFDYKNHKNIFTTKTLLVVEQYSKIQAIRILKDKTKLLLALDKTLVVFDTKTKNTIKEFGTVSMQTSALDISPNFKYIAASGIRGDLKIYDYKTLKLLKTLQVKSYGMKESFRVDIQTIKFIDDDKFLYASSLEGVQLASISSGKVIRQYYNHTLYPVTAIRDNIAYFIAAQDAVIYKYDLKKGKFLEIYDLPLQNIKRLESNQKDNLLLSQKDGKFIIYHLRSKKYEDYHKFLREHYTASFDLHPTKLQFARISSNNALQIFDIKSGKEVVRIKNKIFDIAYVFSFLDDRYMIYSSDYCEYEKKPYLIFIDTKTKKLYGNRFPKDTIITYRLTKDKKTMITGSYDKSIGFWELDLNNHLKATIKDYVVLDSYIQSLALDEKRGQIAVSTNSGGLYIYKIYIKHKSINNNPKTILEGKKPKKSKRAKRSDDEQFDTGFNTTNTVFYRLNCFDNGKKLIATNAQGNIIVYDTNSGKKLYKIVLFENKQWLKIYPNGKFKSSKETYKYIDDKFYDIFKTNKKVLEDAKTQDKIEPVEPISNKKVDNAIVKTKQNNLPFFLFFMLFLVISIFLYKKFKW